MLEPNPTIVGVDWRVTVVAIVEPSILFLGASDGGLELLMDLDE